MMYMMYMLDRVRFIKVDQYYSEIMNEAVIYLTLLIFLIFTNVDLDKERKNEMGWVVIIAIGGNVFVILCTAFYFMVLELIGNY